MPPDDEPLDGEPPEELEDDADEVLEEDAPEELADDPDEALDAASEAESGAPEEPLDGCAPEEPDDVLVGELPDEEGDASLPASAGVGTSPIPRTCWHAAPNSASATTVIRPLVGCRTAVPLPRPSERPMDRDSPAARTDSGRHDDRSGRRRSVAVRSEPEHRPRRQSDAAADEGRRGHRRHRDGVVVVGHGLPVHRAARRG
jgi:hypothetical protein